MKLCRYLLKRFLAPTGIHFAVGAGSKNLVFVQEVSSLRLRSEGRRRISFRGPCFDGAAFGPSFPAEEAILRSFARRLPFLQRDNPPSD
jgi:hypothetical protein